MDNKDRLYAILSDVFQSSTLKKAVLSRPQDSTLLRAEGRTVLLKEVPHLQIETFTASGKALHRNFPLSEAPAALLSEFSHYRQLNLLTTGGDVEARISSKGKLLVSGKLRAGEEAVPQAHDREKHRILREGVPCEFLIALGLTDREGKVFDRKRSKFRQIDRFLQYIKDVYPRLPQSGELYVLDLCCGKSYLTFAAYWFLSEVMGREVTMVGADRKEDVIAFCSSLASRLHWEGLSFLCCDITALQPAKKPALVLSLHACDVATDVVLTTAAQWEADVILSTPCCHHQLFSELSPASRAGALLAPILEHSLLKQKFCDALTDALRCKRLQAAGYSVDVTELIDPEDTPKNLLIRAVKTNLPEEDKRRFEEEFHQLQSLCGVELYGSEKRFPAISLPKKPQ